jgi:hypothetical protein
VIAGSSISTPSKECTGVDEAGKIQKSSRTKCVPLVSLGKGKENKVKSIDFES